MAADPGPPDRIDAGPWRAVHRRPSPPRTGPRILIVKLSAVGDVVHALPVLDALRTALPHAHLAWACHPGVFNLLEGHPQLDEVIVVPRRGARRQWRAGLALLRGGPGAARWDWALDLQGLTKSGLAAWLSRARRRVGFAGPASRELNRIFMTDRVDPAPAPQVVRMNLALLRPLGVPGPDAPRAVLHATAHDEAHVVAWARAAGLADSDRFLVVDPFAGWPTKTWALDRWAEVIVQAQAGPLPLRTLVFHGPGEAAHAADLAARAAARGATPLVAPATTLRQLVALLRAHAAAFAGGDTGPMHIAAALGVPTVALFGPSDPGRNSPDFAGARFHALQDASMPCANTFRRRCRHHPDPGGCLAALMPADVLAALRTITAEP